MADLILTYLPSLRSRCTARQLRAAVDFVLRQAFETNDVSLCIGLFLCKMGLELSSWAEGKWV